MNNTATQEKIVSPVKKVGTVVLNVIIWVFVVFAVIVTMLAFAAQSSADGVPAIAGRCILTVQSDSMKPTFDAGDILIGKKLGVDAKYQLQVGDIITFQADLNDDGHYEYNTHRIVEVLNNDGGTVSYRTQGDNKETNFVADKDPVNPTEVISLYQGMRIPKVGKFLSFLQTSKGFLVCIVLPLALFFFYEMFCFIKKFIEVKNEGKKQITAADEEEIKQRAVQEYLRQQAELQQQQAAAEAAAAQTATAEAPAEPTSENEPNA